MPSENASPSELTCTSAATTSRSRLARKSPVMSEFCPAPSSVGTNSSIVSLAFVPRFVTVSGSVEPGRSGMSSNKPMFAGQMPRLGSAKPMLYSSAVVVSESSASK